MGCDTFFNMGSLRDADVKGSGLEPRGKLLGGTGFCCVFFCVFFLGGSEREVPSTMLRTQEAKDDY